MKRAYQLNFQIMAKIVFASICPHPPILLPDIGSKKDKMEIKKTTTSLNTLAGYFVKAGPDEIIISSPHPDWGFNVPLYFLAKNFAGKSIYYMTELKDPSFYFTEGKKTYRNLGDNTKYAAIASGDLSHCLAENGPYGFNSDGPSFDKELIECIKGKNIGGILKLEERFPNAGECGLRSICFLLGILDADSKSSGFEWQPEILSYEGPFGVGYLVAYFKTIF